MHITNTITLEEIRAAKPTRIYYSARTCWWTHDPAHLSTHSASGLPCDPRGGVLFQTSDRFTVGMFLDGAAAHPSNYGPHGLRAFMAAHHLNCQMGRTDPRPTCAADWHEYNVALDRQDEYEQEARKAQADQKQVSPELVARFEAEMARIALQPVTLQVDALMLWMVISQLQIALRHPLNRGGGAQETRQFIEQVRQHIAPDGSARAEIFQLGYDRDYDFAQEPRA